MGSPASPVLRSAPSPGRPSRRTSFPSLGGTVRALVVRSRGQRTLRLLGLGCSTGCPSRLSRAETTRSPRFLGSPQVCMPRSLTPASSSRQACCGVSIRPSVELTTSALAGIISRGSITRPAHSCVRFAARITPPPRTTRYRLVATLCRAGLVTRWAPPKGFRDRVTSLPPFPGFAWRTRNDNPGKVT